MKKIQILILLLVLTFQLTAQEWTNYDLKDLNLDSRTLYDLDIDSQQNLWLASLSGLLKFDSQMWVVYDSSNSKLPNNELFSVELSEEDNVWVGYSNNGSDKGVSVFDGQKWVTYNKENSNFNSSTVIDIIFDKNNDPWFATFLFLWGYQNNTWTQYKHLEEIDITHSNVFEVEIDKNNDPWFTTRRDGIVKYSNDKLTKYSHINPYSYDGLAVDSNNNVWVVNNQNSLMHFNTITKRWVVRDTTETPLSSGFNIPHTILVDKNNCLWISDKRNLHHFNPETDFWQTYTAPDSIFKTPTGLGFTDFKLDKNGEFWFITAANGVFKLSDVITDVNDYEVNSPNIIIYPNPTTSQLSFECSESELILGYEIIDTKGKVQLQNILGTSATSTIDISGLTSGVYFLQLTNNKGIKLSKKFIVE